METTTKTIIALQTLRGNPLPFLYPMQKFLVPYVSQLQSFWVAVWVMTAVVLLVHVWREYQRHR